MANLEKPKPRIVIELQDDGAWHIISFLAGAQVREAILPGLVEFQVRDALQEQRNRHAAAAERAARKAQEDAAKLHRKVWFQTAYGVDGNRGQGESFANKFVGPIKVNRKENPSAKDKVFNPMDLL